MLRCGLPEDYAGVEVLRTWTPSPTRVGLIALAWACCVVTMSLLGGLTVEVLLGWASGTTNSAYAGALRLCAPGWPVALLGHWLFSFPNGALGLTYSMTVTTEFLRLAGWRRVRLIPWGEMGDLHIGVMQTFSTRLRAGSLIHFCLLGYSAVDRAQIAMQIETGIASSRRGQEL
jgi:hypothetical protein